MAPKHIGSIAMNALAALLCVVLAGCAHSQSMSPTDSKMKSDSPLQDMLPPAAAALLPVLLADAAQRSGVPQDRLRVVRALAVTWPDGSLGCPQPGFSYTQALVPGWQVSIALPSSAASSPALQYHGSDRGGWLHCPADRAVPALPASDDSRM